VGGDGILILITGTDVSSITTSLKHFFRKFHLNGSAVAGRSSSVPSLFVSAAVAEKVVGCILLSCVADNRVCSPRVDTRPRALSARRFDSLDTAVSDTVVIILRCVMRVRSVESVMSVCVCVCVCVVACRPGTYSLDGLTPCRPCPLGTYQADYGRTLCLACGPGITTTHVAATGFHHCVVNGQSLTSTLLLLLLRSLEIPASSSASWSRFSPPSDSVNGHVVHGLPHGETPLSRHEP